MENYEKKYKKALEIARKINSGEGVAAPPDWTSYEVIFPELKESKDERIVKCLLNYFNHVRYNGLDLKGTDVDEVIAWLEKQGEQNSVFTMPPFKAENFYVSKVDGKIHDMTYNPTDKVKPKFKVGDFIANDYCSGKVIEITNDAYLLDTGQGIPFSCEHNAHLWTIEDAKDGDVLVTPPEEGSESNEQIFLFKAINSRDYVDNCIEYYGRLCDDRFYKNKTGYMGTTLDTFYPATKGQRDLLFQKMKEAGYEWDSDKKELKKMEAASKESEDERIRKGLIKSVSRIFEGHKLYDTDVTREEALAWLEKQDKKLDADKVIEWLKKTIRETKEYFGEYGLYFNTNLELPYNSIEDLINDFKEDFGLC